MQDLPAAFVVYRDFPAAPPEMFRMDRHYLLYARAGTMRLEHGGRQWSLPPARAALVRADTAITVTIAHGLSACSVLFDPGRFPPPGAALAVFEVTPLMRELLLACRDWGPEPAPRPALAGQLFATLQALAWDLSDRPSRGYMPLPASDCVRRVLGQCEAHLDADLSFDVLAAMVATTPRTLARRFRAELGLSFGQALRRMRMIRAAEELAMGDAQVTQIALSVGYGSVSAFDAAFRDFCGQGPRDFRAASRASRI